MCPRHGLTAGMETKYMGGGMQAPISTATLKILTVLNWPGVGVASARRIAEYFTREGQERELEHVVAQVLGPDKVSSLSDQQLANSKTNRTLEKCADLSIGIISLCDENYPHNLKDIKDAPPILFYRGHLEAIQQRGCAVVGTRKASSVGMKFASKIASVLAEINLTTVSGLALGIDSAAHTGALEAKGATIAVLAHGLHIIAPPSNEELAEQIIAGGGALLSEHEPDVPPRPPEFVKRIWLVCDPFL